MKIVENPEHLLWGISRHSSWFCQLPVLGVLFRPEADLEITTILLRDARWVNYKSLSEMYAELRRPAGKVAQEYHQPERHGQHFQEFFYGFGEVPH